MSRRVYVHVGAPKTGTTYLQDRLGAQRQEPGRRTTSTPHAGAADEPGMFHFRAALDLLDQDWGGRRGHAEGELGRAWSAGSAARPGTVDHQPRDPRGRPRPSTSARLQGATSAGSEMHIVYSARDLARQAPADWQESVKQGRRWSYGRFLTRVDAAASRLVLPGPSTCPTCSTTLGHRACRPTQVHVVTVPQAGRDRRPTCSGTASAAAFGIDPAWAPRTATAPTPRSAAPRPRCCAAQPSGSDAATRDDPGTTR